MNNNNWKLTRAIMSNELKIDSIVSNINTLKESKQDILMAGENVKIEDNVISCDIQVNDEIKAKSISVTNGKNNLNRIDVGIGNETEPYISFKKNGENNERLLIACQGENNGFAFIRVGEINSNNQIYIAATDSGPQIVIGNKTIDVQRLVNDYKIE